MTRRLIATAAVALAVFAAPAAAQSATINATANVQTPLSLTGLADLNFTTVFPGLAKSVSPVSNGAALATAGQVRIGGQANAEVSVTVTFPTNLTGGGGTLPFSAGSACWSAANSQTGCTVYTPTAALVQRLDAASGFLYLWLGGTVTPGGTLAAGTYSALITVNAAYTGV